MHREPTDSDVSRRRLVGGAAAVGVGLLAGCLGGESESSNQLEGGDDGGGGARLAFLRVANWDAEPHTIHVLVRRDGEVAQWSSHELDGKDRTVPTEQVGTSWAGEGGGFLISVRIDDADEWQTFDVNEKQGDCYGVEARVTDDGGPRLWYAEDLRSCGDGETTSEV
jgi:hypothetical protein